MKNIILYELVQMLQSKPQLKKKLIVFATVGIVFFVLAISLLFWAGTHVVRYAYSAAQNLSPVAARLPQLTEQIPQVTAPLTQFKEQIPQMDSEFRTQLSQLKGRCWNTIQGLMSIQLWLNHPPADHFQNLIAACWHQSTAPCTDSTCSNQPEGLKKPEKQTAI